MGAAMASRSPGLDLRRAGPVPGQQVLRVPPRPKTGSRNQRLKAPSWRAAATTSSARGAEAGSTHSRFCTMPTRAPGTSARIAGTALPWETSTLCATAERGGQVLQARGVDAVQVPEERDTQGSLWVIQSFTRSPRRPTVTRPRSRTNASTVARLAQPPRSWSAWGRSQW